MVKKILLGALAVAALCVVAMVVVVSMQPDTFQVERSASMAAPPDEVFAQVNDFHKWQAWSPWAKLDPSAKNTFEGPDSGEGAIFRWTGDEQVGEGSITITYSHPNEHIGIDLNFIKPFEDQAKVDFTFQPKGDQTEVTWAMSGENNFVSKLMCMFMSMDEMIGTPFEEGLASIKTIVEAPPSEPATQEGEPATKTESDQPAGETENTPAAE